MFTHHLKYGNKKVRIKIENGKLLGILKANKFFTSKTQGQIIKKGLGKRIENFVNKNDRIGIVIPDNTRNAGVKIYLPIIIKKLLEAGILRNNITIFIASGAHKPMNRAEVSNLVPSKISRSFRVICNNAFDRKNFYYAGITRRGTKVLINKEVKKMDKLIATSSVLCHYFAGYGGGPKILMPGLAGQESISSNHRMTLTQNGDFNNKCRNGNIRNNPVYSDIAESVKFFPSVLYLGTVLNDKGKIIKALCGNIINEHKRAARFVDELYKIKIKEKADVVICSAGGFPKDINLIQSHKSIHNAYSALKKNGVLICLAECKEGIGSKTFMQYFNYRNITDLKKNILKEYSLNAQTALSFWDKLSNAKILLVSNLNKNDVQPLIRKGLKIYPKYSDAGKYLNKITRKRSYYIIPASNSLQVQSA